MGVSILSLLFYMLRPIFLEVPKIKYIKYILPMKIYLRTDLRLIKELRPNVVFRCLASG